MSETTLPTPPGLSIPGPTVTLTPSPTTIFITDRITFTTIITLSTFTQLFPEPPPPPPPPPQTPPPEASPISPTDTKFIILVSLTGATFLFLIILAITSIFLFRKHRQKNKHRLQSPENQERAIDTPALTAFPLPPATPRLPVPTDTNVPIISPLFEFTTGSEERSGPTTAPPTRPSRSASTPFLGPEYENKLFTSTSPSQSQLRTLSSQLQKPSTSKAPTTTNNNPSPMIKPRTATPDPSWKLPPIPVNPRKQSTSTPPRFTEEETQIGELGTVPSWFEMPRSSLSEVPGEEREEQEQRETFDFFRFPVSSQGAVGTRASSGVFPEERERERGREGREDG